VTFPKDNFVSCIMELCARVDQKARQRVSLQPDDQTYQHQQVN